MTRSLDIALMVIFMIVAVWLAIFGVAGVLLAPHARMSRLLGFVLGGLLGPIGIGVLLWRGRADLIIPEGTNQTGSQGSDEDHRPGPAPTGIRF